MSPHNCDCQSEMSHWTQPVDRQLNRTFNSGHWNSRFCCATDIFVITGWTRGCAASESKVTCPQRYAISVSTITAPKVYRTAVHFVIIGCTWGGHGDHLKCSQWLQSSQHDYLSVSVYAVMSPQEQWKSHGPFSIIPLMETNPWTTFTFNTLKNWYDSRRYLPMHFVAKYHYEVRSNE